MTLKEIIKKHRKIIYSGFILILFLTIGLTIIQFLQTSESKQRIFMLSESEKKLLIKINDLNNQLKTITSEDQFVKNQKQEEEIKHIYDTYKKTVQTYESLLKLKDAGGNTDKLDELISESLTFLSDKNYSSAEAVLSEINTGIKKENESITKKATEFTISKNVAVNNAPPSSGYQRQQVSTEIGNFLMDIVSADLNSTKVIIDTASDNTCTDNCPVLSLADYASRSGAYAGINGSYFCPASYPSCAGKTNSFDTLLMNKNKVYFNSENNVYSNVPVAVFGSGWARFMGRSLDWGRDTGVDGVIANQPLLLSGGNIAFGGDGDPKKGSKGPRSFIGNKGGMVYIGVTHNATVAENAYVLKALGLENALNLDSGGSTALWTGGYKVGPGRNIPNAVLFVRR